MNKTLCGAGVTACLMALAACADPAATTNATNPVTGTPSGTTGGTPSGGQTGATAGTPTNGQPASTGGEQMGGSTASANSAYDASAEVPSTSDCVDDPTTLGNDCPGLVTCSDAVDSCSLSSQNCCVKDYDPDAVTCNEGTACDGLAKAACDGPEDCSGGQLCCISVSVGFSVEINHRCVADVGSCNGGSIVNRILCHSDDGCAAGESCEPIGNLPFWGICK